MTPFHTLMLSQGVADIYSLLTYNFFSGLRVTNLFNDFFWDNQQFIANFTFVNIYYTLYLRCIGITLISLQRYITVCQSGTRVERKVDEDARACNACARGLPVIVEDGISPPFKGTTL
ncbi:hypothetical protein ANCCEY_02780 [Ancylostoma ceylanicum]|uniref:Uncharacterized protein n=1 Tax=Ancylostoma ceylanicum TaxID=53326 RepID=A0A0D6M1H9_9BILA|nr:hypothetical protein ANCCEY_02780 [Ancylostoma ceylanicum]